jgi:long-chain acyl-CoA synthetase
VAAAEDYFFNSATKRLIFGRLFDVIAFDRQADGLSGLRRCAEALDRGDGLLIFPEGTRTVSGRMQPFKMGVAALAIERQTPIVPVYIGNAFTLLPKGSRFPKPGILEVRFGAPLVPPPDASPDEPYAHFQELTRRIEAAVTGLAKQVVA